MEIDSQHDNVDNNERCLDFLTLLGKHERSLRAFVMAMTCDWNDTDDIVQEVRIRLWQQFDEFDHDKDFGRWSRTIAKYQIMTLREKSSRNRMLFVPEYFDAISAAVEHSPEELQNRQEALDNCLKKLPVKKRATLLSCYQGDKTMRVLATENDVTYNAFRHTVIRIRKWLARCVETTMSSS